MDEFAGSSGFHGKTRIARQGIVTSWSWLSEIDDNLQDFLGS
jgi:hypothetical protein